MEHTLNYDKSSNDKNGNILTVHYIKQYKHNNRVLGYRLQDNLGNERDVEVKELKDAMRSGRIHVTNLMLTSGNEQLRTLDGKKYGVQTVHEIGTNTGNLYTIYLDENIFGKVAKDYNTVGHIIKHSDLKNQPELHGYKYIFSKDIKQLGAPCLTLDVLFKDLYDGSIGVDIKVGRLGYITDSLIGVCGYIYKLDSFKISSSEDPRECARITGSKLNKLAPKLYSIADANQSLYRLKRADEPLEQITKTEIDTTYDKFISLAISRWTELHGDKKPATIKKTIYNNSQDFKIFFNNNISENGKDRTIMVERRDFKLTLNIIDNTSDPKIISHGICNVKQSLNDSSREISKLVNQMMINSIVSRI